MSAVRRLVAVLAGFKSCSVCGALFDGDHCPNCGWFARDHFKEETP